MDEKSELEALKEKLESLESIIRKDKKCLDGLPRKTSMQVTSDLINLLKLSKIGEETHEEVILRLYDDAETGNAKLRKITALVAQEGDFENTVKAIRRILELEEIDTPFYEEREKLESTLNNRARKTFIDYEEVEKRYDQNLTDAENAENIGISLSSFVTWRNSKGYPARGRKKGSEWNKKSKR